MSPLPGSTAIEAGRVNSGAHGVVPIPLGSQKAPRTSCSGRAGEANEGTSRNRAPIAASRAPAIFAVAPLEVDPAVGAFACDLTYLSPCPLSPLPAASLGGPLGSVVPCCVPVPWGERCQNRKQRPF